MKYLRALGYDSSDYFLTPEILKIPQAGSNVWQKYQLTSFQPVDLGQLKVGWKLVVGNKVKQIVNLEFLTTNDYLHTGQSYERNDSNLYNDKFRPIVILVLVEEFYWDLYFQVSWYVHPATLNRWVVILYHETFFMMIHIIWYQWFETFHSSKLMFSLQKPSFNVQTKANSCMFRSVFSWPSSEFIYSAHVNPEQVLLAELRILL